MAADDPARVPLIDADRAEAETAELLGALGNLNIFRALANHPKLMKRWLVFGAHVLNKSTLDPRHRELIILRVGWRCQSEYEFGQHTVIGRDVGLTDDEIIALTRPAGDGHAVGWEGSGFDELEGLLLRAADELLDDYEISTPTWNALSAHLDEQQLMDLVFCVGQYSITCMALKSLRVPLDEGVPGFPDGGTGT